MMRVDEFDHVEFKALDAEMTQAENETGPGYWMYESSGVLRPAVERYLNGEQLSANDIVAMRTYLRQWIKKGDFRGPEIKMLRDIVDSVDTREQIKAWSDLAISAGCDPW
jgi:hypothetical protein